MRLFCFGYGYVARHLAQEVRRRGGQVSGTSRSGQGMHRLDSAIPMDAAGVAALHAATHVLVSIPPEADGLDAALRHHKADIHAGQWLGYLSTTGVYGDYGGDWVTEKSPLKTTEPRSLRRIEVEQTWQRLGADCFRLAGIYGEGRNLLENLQNGTARHIVKPGHYFSRIHVEDIVQVLLVAMAEGERGNIYNLADDMPASSHEVLAYACQLTGQELPPAIPYDEAELSPMAQSFYAANRRVCNRKVKEKLAIRWKHPDYRQGLASILHSKGSF